MFYIWRKNYQFNNAKIKTNKKKISLKEAEEIIIGGSQIKKHSQASSEKDKSKKAKKTVKSPQIKKKIRKK